MKRRNWKGRRFAAWLLGVGAVAFSASVCQASPPAVIDISLHPERIHQAASVFGDAEREWFRKELTKISGPDRYLIDPPPVRWAAARTAHELDRALIGLICPSLQRGELEKIKKFFTTVNKERLVRGHGNYEGWMIVSYHLLQDEARRWRLEARHQNVSGPSERATPLREQTAPSFATHINCADPHYGPAPK